MKLRPRTISIPPRTANAIGETPRIVTLVGCPSLRRGLLLTTTISGEASGRPSAPRATRESTTIRLRWSSGTHEVSSLADPRCTTIAFCGMPVERRARRTPATIASSTTSTATTRLMPRTARNVTCQRSRRLRRL